MGGVALVVGVPAEEDAIVRRSGVAAAGWDVGDGAFALLGVRDAQAGRATAFLLPAPPASIVGLLMLRWVLLHGASAAS